MGQNLKLVTGHLSEVGQVPEHHRREGRRDFLCMCLNIVAKMGGVVCSGVTASIAVLPPLVEDKCSDEELRTFWEDTDTAKHSRDSWPQGPVGGETERVLGGWAWLNLPYVLAAKTLSFIWQMWSRGGSTLLQSR